MQITYEARKDIPCVPLHKLFVAVGWSDKEEPPKHILENFNIGFLNSTVVFSAWDGDELVGCIRALSDKMFRSVIYDLAVLPEYQNKGIGTELVRRCKACYPDSEWVVQTEKKTVGYYEKLGFKLLNENEAVLSSPCKWFTV